MEDKLLLLGRTFGLVGVVVCLAAMLLRLAGLYAVGGFSLSAVMQGGMALVVIGCFAILQRRV